MYMCGLHTWTLVGNLCKIHVRISRCICYYMIDSFLHNTRIKRLSKQDNPNKIRTWHVAIEGNLAVQLWVCGFVDTTRFPCQNLKLLDCDMLCINFLLIKTPREHISQYYSTIFMYITNDGGAMIQRNCVSKNMTLLYRFYALNISNIFDIGI